MKYSYLLFDADDTLFDFPRASARAFSIMCSLHNIPDTPEVYQIYHQINLELWSAFDRGEVSKEFVTLERYVRFLQAIGSNEDPVQCNDDYLSALGEGVYPLPHAEEVCRTLVERGHRLYIVTNAVASVQRSRLRGSVFSRLITDAFISEDEIPWPPTSGAPTMRDFPAAGSTPATFPGPQICASTMRLRTCGSC